MLALGAALTGVAAGWIGIAEAGPHDAGARTVYAYVTYYGWYDNTPPGCATAYAGCAGGVGTYGDPITLASDQSELPVGSRVYYPTLQKYFVMQDDCQECDEDWSHKGPDGGPDLHHVDLWTGGRGGNELSALSCEDALTQSTAGGGPLLTPLIVNPPSGLPVSSEPIFSSRTRHCYGGAAAPASYDSYRNAALGTCLADPHSASTAASLAPCGSAPTEDLEYQGAFLSSISECLQADGGGAGALIVFSRCTGGPSQQWSENADGTITWIQHAYCLGERSGSVRLASCDGQSPEQWRLTPERPPRS